MAAGPTTSIPWLIPGVNSAPLHLGVPFGVARVFCHVSVEIGSTVRPPDRAALAEGALGVVDSAMGGCFGIAIGGRLGVADGSPRRHQALDQLRLFPLAQMRIRHPPQPSADDEVSTVQRDRMFHAQADFRRAPVAGFFAAASFVCFLPAIGISISF